MKELKRGWMFWALLLVSSLVLPASAQTAFKKQLYQAPIISEIRIPGETQVAQAMLIVSSSGYDYMIRVAYQPENISRITMAITDDPNSRKVVLCDDAGLVPCIFQYPSDIDGTIVPLMLQYAENGPIALSEFRTALSSGNLTIALNDGDRGSGTFVRIY